MVQSRVVAWRMRLSALWPMPAHSRSKAHEKYPDMWKALSGKMDDALTETYELLFSKGVPPLNFARAHRPVLLLFVSEADLGTLETCMKDDISPPVSTLQRVIHASRCMACNFSEAAKKLDYECFLERVSKGLRDLEFNGFEQSEVESFRHVMLRATAGLVSAAFKSYEKKEMPISFMGAAVMMSRGSLDDEWEFRYSAKIKTLSANGGALRLLPSEAALYKCGDIPGAPQTVRPDAALLSDAANAREVVLRTMASESAFAEMKRCAANHAKAWLGLDRTFSLELVFLNEHVEKLALEQIHKAVLCALPSGGEHKSFAPVLLAVYQVKISTVCMASGGGAVAEVDGVHSMIASLDEGVGPAARDITQFSHFYKTVVAKLPYFLQRSEISPKTGVFKKTLTGRAALQDLFYTMAHKFETNERVGIKCLQPLRAYKWLLNDEQNAQVTLWNQAATLAQASLTMNPALTDMDAGDDAETRVCVMTTTALASPGADKQKKQQGGGEKGGGEATTRGTNKADLMHCFVGRSK